MKKQCFIFIFFICCCVLIFGNNTKQEEVDFLLFLPNSSNRFENEEQAFIQLNNLAHYLSNKNLVPGQIIIYGYAAFAQNDIESVALSRERAVFVMNELQRRGISRDFFSDPVGYGSVYLWGDNANENDRKFNRRVRILLDGESPIAITPEIVNAEIETVRPPDKVHEEPAAPKDTLKKSGFKFPWWILLLFAIILALLLRKGSRRKPAHKDETAGARPRIPKTDTAPDPVLMAAMSASMVNLDDEIRQRAYELYQRRNEQGDYKNQDWYNAVREISAWYTACGHSVFSDAGSWWAAREYNS